MIGPRTVATLKLKLIAVLGVNSTIRQGFTPLRPARPHGCGVHRVQSCGRITRGHKLRDFQLAAVLELSGDAGIGAEGMAADLDPGQGSPPGNHPPDIGMQHGRVGQIVAAPFAGAKERPLAILRNVRRFYVGLKVLV
jgi:hypothetical protein